MMQKLRVKGTADMRGYPWAERSAASAKLVTVQVLSVRRASPASTPPGPSSQNGPAPAAAAEYAVDVIRPIRVTRIDITYDYAPGVGLASHTEQDGGDIFAPAGTTVIALIEVPSAADRQQIDTVADAVKAKMKKIEPTILKGMTILIDPATDQGTQVHKQLGDLTQTGFETVILVIIALLLTIGWRESLVAALSIPLSFLIAFIGLYATGNTLNFISLFSLILAVGILVDSGIVVTEAIHARMRIYGEPFAAARAALHDYAWPLIAAMTGLPSRSISAKTC